MYFGVDYERICMYKDFNLRQDIPAKELVTVYAYINVIMREILTELS